MECRVEGKKGNQKLEIPPIFMRGIISIVKMSTLLKMSYGFKAIPRVGDTNKSFYRTRKSHPEIATEAQKTPNSPNNPGGKRAKLKASQYLVLRHTTRHKQNSMVLA